MAEPQQNGRFTQAYDRMMERMLHRFDDLGAAGQGVVHRLQQSLEHAIDQAVELDELSREEARMIAGYLKRDLEDAGRHMGDSDEDLGAWLRFDVELIEQRLLDYFSRAADQTRLAMLAFQDEIERASHYRAGEITGPGTLACEDCGEQQRFRKTTQIPACPNCGAVQFVRVSSRPRG